VKTHSVSLIFNEILLCLLLTYNYLYNTYIFLPTEIFSVSIATIIMIVLIVFFSILVTFRHYKTFSYIEYLLIGLLLLYAVLASRITQELWFKNTPLYWGIFSVFMGIMMSRDRDLHSLVFWTPLIVILVSIVFEICLHPNNAKGGMIGDLNYNSLGMMASTLSMLITMNYAIQKKLHTKLALFLPFVLLCINYFAIGRAGLLMAMMLIVIVYGDFFLGLIRRNWNVKEYRKRTIRLILFCLILTLMFFILIIFNSRFTIMGMGSSDRVEIYTSFLNELNFKSFLTGFTPSILEKFNHLHNSFFQLIAYAGLFSIPMFVIILMTIKNFLVERNFLILLLGMTFANSLVEYYMFLRYGDLILFPLIIYSFYLNKQKHYLEKDTLQSDES